MLRRGEKEGRIYAGKWRMWNIFSTIAHNLRKQLNIPIVTRYIDGTFAHNYSHEEYFSNNSYEICVDYLENYQIMYEKQRIERKEESKGRQALKASTILQ